MPIFGCSLYCQFGTIYSALPPVYAMQTAVPDIYNVITARHILASIFNWMYQSCYWRHSDTSMRVVLQIWSQIQRTSSSLRYVYCGSGHIRSIYSSAYSVLQYSTVGICAAIVDITSIQCALYCKLGAKCRAHPPAFAMWTVLPHKYKVFTGPHIYASIFDGMYLRCYWR
jgi:hypothetical protein